MIDFDGNAIVYNDDTFACSHAAAKAANAYRQRFWCVADKVDWRQARCI
jgi:hypothetical protein